MTNWQTILVILIIAGLVHCSVEGDAGARRQKDIITSRVAARMIGPDNPERFYLSDGLAAKLNEGSRQLAEG